jgi:group I intron endonuclease
MGWAATEPSAIYAIRCKENGRVYIGRTSCVERRIKEHFTELRKGQKTCRTGATKVYGKSLLQEDYDKYSEDAFEVYVLEEDIQPEKCKERESFWIAEYNSTNAIYGYNKLSEQGRPELPSAKRGMPPNKFKEEMED